jgi:STE24 endopeptidase
MPLSLLIALVLAFGIEAGGVAGPYPPGEVPRRVAQAGAGLAAVAVAAFLAGRLIAWRVARRGRPTPAIRRAYSVAGFLIQTWALAYYAWVIYGLGWPRVVGWGLGLRGALLADEILIFLPFLLAQLAVWWGLFAAERALRGPERARGMVHSLVRRARQSMGLVLPVALAYVLARDLLRRYWPEWAADPWVETAGIALTGGGVLALAPALVRITFPTRPLEPGPLRDRLERLAERFRFRCTDILVWDTGGGMVNAFVTGVTRWFRYVVLTDALIECLDDREIEAVFGHEIGHIAHRHLSFFGLFFLGTMGVMALIGHGIELVAVGPWRDPTWATVLKAAAGLAALGVYFLLLFGFLSRRFERQADVFGCRAVSCGRADCPPHADLNAYPIAVAPSSDLCPVGIRIFANALTRVHELNGLDEGMLAGLLAWRHGRVARRVAFLNDLEGHPEVERRFQAGVRRLRLAVALLLAAAVATAVATDSLRHLVG